MRKWLTVGGAALVGATLAVSAYAVTNTQADKRAAAYKGLELFLEVFSKAQSDYVVEIDETKAIEAGINGMLGSLDPHSSYMNPSDFRNMQVQTAGEYGGLGLEVSGQDGFVKVVAPMDDTPASRAGIKSGDFLTAIDGKSIVGLSLDEAVQQMRGQVGTEISITVAREGVEPFDVTLKREKIRPDNVKFRAEGDIGYVRIASFNERTSESLDEALNKLRGQVKGPMKGLVVDLRDNPGGLLEQAIEVSSRFIPSGEIVSTRGRRPDDVERYNARKRNRVTVPVVVLVNGGSASAAEIVAGAIQDRGRGKVLGLTSFGKGSVQTIIPLGAQKGAIRLTTSRYYTPAGRSIQGTGIEPDVEVAQERLTEQAIADLKKRAARYTEASLPHALQNENGAERKPPHVPADMPPADYKGKDYQLDQALALIRSGKAMAPTDVASSDKAPAPAQPN